MRGVAFAVRLDAFAPGLVGCRGVAISARFRARMLPQMTLYHGVATTVAAKGVWLAKFKFEVLCTYCSTPLWRC